MNFRDWYSQGFKSIGRGAKIYCIWAALSIFFAVAVAGRSAESVTRILVIVFLFCQIALHSKLSNTLSWLSPKKRFIVLGTLLASVVEGFHMISTPVFLSLRIGWTTSFKQGLLNYLIDLAFTVPAYLVIFSVIWYFANRYNYKLWHYIIIMGLAQALGDGGIFFFIGAPQLLLFLPYPMTNYHAVNVIPFLATYNDLRKERISSAFAYLAIPGVILTYLFCGSVIKIVGKKFGFQ